MTSEISKEIYWALEKKNSAKNLDDQTPDLCCTLSFDMVEFH